MIVRPICIVKANNKKPVLVNQSDIIEMTESKNFTCAHLKEVIVEIKTVKMCPN